MALMLGACSSIDEEAPAFTKTSADGSFVQSVPTPLEAVPENAAGGDDEAGATSVGRDRGGAIAESAAPPPPPPAPSVSAAPSGSADIAVTGSRLESRGEKLSRRPADPTIALGELAQSYCWICRTA